MKTLKHYFFVAILGIFLFPLALVAQTASTSDGATSTEPLLYVAPNEPVRTRMGSTTELMKARIIERRSLFALGVKNRVKNLFDNVHNRMIATVARFEHIEIRLNSRMAKMEAAGLNTASARVKLQIAKNETASAKELLSKNIERDVDAIVDNASPTLASVMLRNRVGSILTHLRLAQTALAETVVALKVAGVQTSSVEATSTPTNLE